MNPKTITSNSNSKNPTNHLRCNCRLSPRRFPAGRRLLRRCIGLPSSGGRPSPPPCSGSSAGAGEGRHAEVDLHDGDLGRLPEFADVLAHGGAARIPRRPSHASVSWERKSGGLLCFGGGRRQKQTNSERRRLLGSGRRWTERGCVLTAPLWGFGPRRCPIAQRHVGFTGGSGCGFGVDGDKWSNVIRMFSLSVPMWLGTMDHCPKRNKMCILFSPYFIVCSHKFLFNF